MNLGFVMSTIIGGLLILSIITLNLRVSQHSGENTLYHTAKINTDMIAEVMTYDLRQVAYGFNDAGSGILQANSTTFQYQTRNTPVCLANPPSSPELWKIKWEYDSNANTLTCTVEGEQEVLISSAVKDFDFTYFNSSGQEIFAEPDSIKQIKVRLITESAAKYGNQSQAPSSAWEATFTPRSLNLGSI